VKIGGRSILDARRSVVYPVVEALARILADQEAYSRRGRRLVWCATRHVFSIALDLGLPTGVLAQLSAADANGNAHILGTLLAPHGVVGDSNRRCFGHLLPLFHPRGTRRHLQWRCRRIPSGSIRRAWAVFRPHRTDAGLFLARRVFRVQNPWCW